MMSTRHTKSMVIATIFVVVLQELTFSASATEVAINNNSLWSEINRVVEFLLNKCLTNNIKEHNQLHRSDETAPILGDCLKLRGLRALDRALDRDVIEITDNVVLVKWKNDTEPNGKDDRSWRERKRKTLKTFKLADHWNHELSEKVVRFLKTRILRITFKGFNRTIMAASEARHRHKNNMFGQMMMFGMVAAGLIVIPMGFQFLAVLGGKALLLAKLALLLTSIQGLKKIATSNVNYGLYSTGHAEPWHYDRQWRQEADPYPTTFHPSGIGAPLGHDLYSSNVPPIYNTFHPQGEHHLSA